MSLVGRFANLSQRTQLMGIVFLAMVLLGAFYLYTIFSSRDIQEAQAESQVLSQAKLVAVTHQEWLEESENLLFALSTALHLHSEPQLQPYCTELFASFMSRAKGFDIILLVAPNGDLLCAPQPVKRPVNFSDRSYFKRAKQSRGFSVGEYIIGRVSGRRVLPLALPSFRDNGELDFLLVAGRELDWIGELITRQQFSAQGEVIVIDGQGTVLGRYPNGERYREKPLTEKTVLQAVREHGQGSLQAVDEQGVRRFYGYTQLGENVRGITVIVSRPYEQLMSTSRHFLFSSLWQLASALILVAGALWFGIGRLILEPLQQLSKSMQHISNGQTDERIQHLGRSSEFGQIASSFNVMLDTLQKATDQLRLLSEKDPLIDIANRRVFIRRFEEERKRAQRLQQPLTLLMIDIDYFKRYNDSYGHQQGDRALLTVAEVIKQGQRRAGDLAARYGGEEFVLLLPDTDAEGAIHLAKELQQQLDARAIAHNDSDVSDRITISIGIATASDYAASERLLANADKALYQAKHTGRNGWVHSRDLVS